MKHSMNGFDFVWMSYLRGGEQVEEELTVLAKGPLMVVKKYNSYAINGYIFHTQAYDEGRPGQSSGVALVAQTSSNAGVFESSTITNKIYYGIITEIIELSYHRRGNIVLFKCLWVDNQVENNWVKVDKFGITSVNFKHLCNMGEKPMDEPFILSSQANQVYYVPDPMREDWCAVRMAPPRDHYDTYDGPNLKHLEFMVQDPVVDLNIDVDFIAARHGSTTVRKLENVKKREIVLLPLYLNMSLGGKNT